MKITPIVLYGLLLLSTPLYAEQPMSAEELQRWFESDEMPEKKHVNEGELSFLPKQSTQGLLHSTNSLTISKSSIDSGWVQLEQCYLNLDAVPEAEVVYRYRHMRGLTVLSAKKIARAYIQGQSVQIENVSKGAELCVAAEVRIFYQNPDGSFSLVNGPFHRKFLDGYYPYHVTLEIHYPADKLKLLKTIPAAQAGYRVTKTSGGVTIDSVFEGILNTETVFAEIN